MDLGCQDWQQMLLPAYLMSPLAGPINTNFLSVYYLAVTRLTFMSSDSLNNHMRYFYVLHFMNEDMKESIFPKGTIPIVREILLYPHILSPEPELQHTLALRKIPAFSVWRLCLIFKEKQTFL